MAKVDVQEMMMVFKEMIKEERKEMMEMFLKHIGGTNQSSSTEIPNMMSALSNRIEKFNFDPEADECFSKWYARYKEVFVEDAKQLPESARVRLLCEKLDKECFEKYQSMSCRKR